jgi:hypothetical protein
VWGDTLIAGSSSALTAAVGYGECLTAANYLKEDTMAEIDLTDIDDRNDLLGLTIQLGRLPDVLSELSDDDYDLFQMDNEVTVVINESILERIARTSPQSVFPMLVLEGVIDGLINATAAATESLKTLREKVSNDAR